MNDIPDEIKDAILIIKQYKNKCKEFYENNPESIKALERTDLEIISDTALDNYIRDYPKKLSIILSECSDTHFIPLTEEKSIEFIYGFDTLKAEILETNNNVEFLPP